MDAPSGFNVHHLELFYHVARAGGITASLKSIPYGIQQPAVSFQMAQLEEAVGSRLFQRKPFSLTPMGRQIFEFIAPFFGGLPELASAVHGRSSRHLRLAATANVMRDHFPMLLRELERLLPGLRLTLRDAPLDGAARLLREHEVDLALALHDPATATGLRSVALLTLPMVLLVAGDPPRGGSTAILRQVAKGDIPLIAPPVADILTRRFQEELHVRKLEWNVRIEAPGLDLVEAYVGEGFGVGLGLAVPGRRVPARIRAIPLRGFPKLTYSAFWNERLTPVAQTCLERMQVLAAGL